MDGGDRGTAHTARPQLGYVLRLMSHLVSYLPTYIPPAVGLIQDECQRKSFSKRQSLSHKESRVRRLGWGLGELSRERKGKKDKET